MPATDHAAPTGPPAAVLVPPDYADAVGRDVLTRHVEALLGGPSWFGKDAQTGLVFGRRDPHDSRLFPKGHALQGRERYRWFRAVAPDFAPGDAARPTDGAGAGLLVGYLVPEATDAAE